MPDRELRVLHLVGGTIDGGAARGAYWLHRGLIDLGVHSRMLMSGPNDTSDNSVLALSNGQKARLVSALRARLDNAPLLMYPHRPKTTFSTGLIGSSFMKTNAYAEAHVVHLHWINGGLVGIRDLKKIRKPLVWTLRDMWPMTGGCHYPMNCDNFLKACGECPQLGSSTKYDLSRAIHMLKKRNIPADLIIVGLSEWISQQARESSIFSRHEIRTIPNNIDTESFYPVEKEIARSILGIKSGKKVVLLGAQSIHDIYKGFENFRLAVKRLPPDRYQLCFFGRTDPDLPAKLGFEYHEFGFLCDDIALRLVYSAADVFVSPSQAESFGKTIAEAMACGTPVVCFDAGGPRDIVDHSVNGYRAIPFDSEDLARGIEWIAGHVNPRQLSTSAREKIIQKFDCQVVARQYVELYRDILRRQ